jgi:anti-sigma regulatory factor (Ser/Thr protein kinase)
MHGKTGTAREDSADGHARHVEATQRAAPLVRGDPHTGQPSPAVRIPPFVASQDNSWASQWPLQSFLELGAFPGAVPCARLHARQMLWEWRLTALSDIAELLISELVTNAVQISCADAQTTPVRLWMMASRTRVLILVWDSSPLPPVRMSTSQDDENGRGLLLVETLSTRWDWYFLPQHNGGKVVWFELQLSTCMEVTSTARTVSGKRCHPR